MSKLQNMQDQTSVLTFRRLTPSEYQQIRRHNDAVQTIAEQCAIRDPQLTDLAWAEHMADILFPLKVKLD
jgi:hypothetical protein